MKRLVFILVYCYCILHNLFAQNYVAEYQSKNIKGLLTFNTTDWRYDATELQETAITFELNGIDLDEESSIISKLISTFNFRSLDKNYYLDEEMLPSKNKCVIKGKLIKPEWMIVSDSVKTIENYTCLMAKGHVRGRDYTVWFTPDIPVSAGPWKLWGLPGLIVSARSDDGVVEAITMISLKQAALAPVEPIVNTTVSNEEFKPLFNDAIKKINKDFRTVFSNISETAIIDFDTKVSFDKCPDKSLFE